jgi:hypothetical protein
MSLETNIINSFIEFIGKIVKYYASEFGLKIQIESASSSIDERIKKIDAAKQNLQEGLLAIKELEEEAEKNKQEAKIALDRINQLNSDKNLLLEEVTLIKRVINVDVGAFQKVAGVPTERQIKRERIIGFISGIVASIVATALIWLFVQGYYYFFGGN